MSLLAAVGGALLLSAHASAALSPQVVGGQDTSIEAVPFQVALYDPQVDPNPANSNFCGGVIIDSTHIITAAHCVFDETTEQISAPQEIEVLAGTENLEETTGAVEDPVRATSFNPEWNRLTGEHDDAVLTLEHPLWSSATPPSIGGATKIAPIKLATSLAGLASSATVSGWGFSEELRGEQQPTKKEAEEHFLATLRFVQVPLVSSEECAKDYELQEGETLGPDFICAGEEGKDSCYGDSGGPLFTGPVGSGADELIATVDLGHGCGQKGFPSLYQSVVEHENKMFLQSDPPQGPFQARASPPAVLGTAQPGQTLTCDPGSWAGDPQLFYAFFRDETEFSNPLAVSALTPQYTLNATYDLPSATAAGTRVFCTVLALNAGGYSEAISKDVTVSGTSQPPAANPKPTAPAPPVPPTLTVISKGCKHSSCSVNVLASAGTGDAVVATVKAKLTFTRKAACRGHAARASCTRTVTRTLTAKATPAGHFVITASGLKPGSYTLSLTAIDKDGIAQSTPTKIALVLKAPKPKRHS